MSEATSFQVRDQVFGDDMQLYMLRHSGQKTAKRHSDYAYEWHGTITYVTGQAVEDENHWQNHLFFMTLQGQLPHLGKNAYAVDIVFDWQAHHGELLPNGSDVKCLITLGYVSTISDYQHIEEGELE